MRSEWTTQNQPVVNTITYLDNVIEIEGPIEGSNIQSAASNAGFSKFYVLNSQGNNLTEDDFPFNGDVELKSKLSLAE